MKVTLVSDAVARELVGMDDAIAAVESAFRALAAGSASVFPAMAALPPSSGTRFGVKAGAFSPGGPLGLKIGSYWPANPSAGRAAHGSTTVLLDPDTGYPQAIVGASWLNGLRTAAADAVAARALARPDARTLGVVGAGAQAAFEVQALRRVRSVDQVLVWSRDAARARALAERLASEGVAAEASSLAGTAARADILVTVTAARAPLVASGMVREGTHVSAMGADGVGKQELDLDLVARATLFADWPEQSVWLGEFQHAAAAGRAPAAGITAIGDVLAGTAAGRRTDDEVTIFDSSGLGVQDLALAALALERARAHGRAATAEL